MPKTLHDLRPVYVVGIGWHRYQPMSETPYVTLGLKAVRDALKDAKLTWEHVDSSFVGTGLLGMASGRPMLRHLGALGKPIVHVENASASGSAAFRHACIDVASGLSDVSLTIGIDKPAAIPRARTGVPNLADDAIVPFTHFAMLTNEYCHKHGTSPEDVALVAVKNHRNGARNPNAHRQKERTLEEVLGGKAISGTLTSLQCCPVGEGAAAVIVASDEAIRHFDLDRGRAIRVTASATASERVGTQSSADATLTVDTVSSALAQARVRPDELDIVELHDAFTIEELHYVEAMGICRAGEAVRLLKEGAFNIGGQCAVSPSGGLIAMGHPIGPTGVGQIGEITLQLRGDAGPRQHKGAKRGLAHMVGLGAVCYAHILERP
jgi:acetyl-CoA acetyltransferase